MKKITLFICAIFLTMAGYSQDCANTSSYGSANVSTPGTKQISTCNYYSEFSTINGVNAGYEYEFSGIKTSDSALAFITVRSGSSNGPVVGSGVSPLTVTAPSSDSLYVHWNTNAECGVGSGCAVTTATCITCATIEDCEGVPGGSVLPGTACDDGDAGTVNDVYDADCNCAGTPPTAASVCSTAIPVICNADPATYSSAASNGTNTTTCSMGNNGLWFSFMGTGGDITVNSTSTFDHEMSINSGSCESLINIGCKDGSIGAETYTITNSVVGEMYYVYIARYNSGSTVTGDITISIVCATPPNCVSPSLVLAVQDVDGNAITDCLEFGTSYYVSATLSGGEGNTSYNVTANAGAAVVVAADNSAVFGPFTLGTNVSVVAVGAQDGDCTVTTSTNSPLVCPPLNDDCDGAIALVCGVPITGSTANATSSGLSATCGSYTSSSALDLFYSFEADGTSSYQVSLNAAPSASFDGILFVYSGACGSLTSLGCSDDGNPEEIMELLAPAAGTYIVRIFRYTSTGAFTLGLTCTAAPECTLPTLALSTQDVDGNEIDSCVDAGGEYYVLATLSGGAGNTLYNVTANSGAAVEVAADDSVVFGPFTVGTNVSVSAVGVQDGDCDVTSTVNSPALCPPTNDNCDGAIALVCNAAPISYSSVGAVGTAPAGCSVGSNGIWFSFVGTGADITINSTASFDHKMSMQTGLCNDLTWIACKDGSVGAETYTIASSILNQNYYVYIAHYSSSSTTTGNITVSIVCAVVPECTLPTLTLSTQDVDGNAITDCLEAGSSYYVLATLSGGDGNTSYSVTANGGTSVEVDADDSVVVGPFTSGTNVSVSAVGVQDGDCDVTASVNSPVLCPPTNVNCDDAVALVCNAGPITYTSVGAIGTAPAGCSLGSNGLWFTFVGTGADITIKSTASFDHEMSINSGSCGSLVNLGCRDSSTGAESYTITSSVLDEDYYVYIAHFDASSTTTGNITVSIECAVVPDCTLPILTLSTQDVDGNAITGCLEAGSTYYVLATLSGGGGNASYSVTANGGASVEVAADDSVVVGPFNIGTSVSVSAVGVQDGDCDVSASVNSPAICGPVNENCENAIALSCDDSVSGTTVGASYSGLTDGCTSRTTGDVFYTLDVESGNEYTVSVIGSNYDAVLAIYSGACGSLTEIDCADNGFVDGAEETITFTATATETIVIRTYDWSTTAGDFTISVLCTALSVNENNTLAGTRLYPNPLNDDTFYVYAPQLNGERVEVNIADMAGRQIFNNTLDCADNKVSVSLNDALTSGMYLVTLKHAGETHTYRLVKE